MHTAILVPIFQEKQKQYVNIITLANTVKDSESCRSYLQLLPKEKNIFMNLVYELIGKVLCIHK
jgi:response regulator of citrate/malate metabolism